MSAAEIDPTARCAAATVGAGSRVGAFAVIDAGATLGRDVHVGHHAVIADGVTVGDGAVVGDGALVAAGVQIGSRAVVSAGAVVDRAVPGNAVVAGNPAAITGYVGLGGQRAMEPVRQVDAPPAGPSGDVLDSVVAGVQLHRLPEVRDLRGSLVAGELAGRLPFVVRRYFLVFDVPGSEIRGEHAHFECHQFLVAVAGELHVIADDGKARQEFVLDDRRTGLYLPPLVWGVQYQYSRDCVLMVLASHEYDPADYIRDYSQYLTEIQRKP